MPREDTLHHLTALYDRSDDPWGHRMSHTEQAEYAATLQAIGLGPFHHAVEVGCGDGTLLAHLGPRCLRLTPDLLILSEVLYFLTPQEIAHLDLWVRKTRVRTVAVNWLGPTEEDLDGTTALACLMDHLGAPDVTTMAETYRIDVLGMSDHS